MICAKLRAKIYIKNLLHEFLLHFRMQWSALRGMANEVTAYRNPLAYS
jgi:hypothetical protein